MLKIKYLLPLILILFLTFALIGDCSVTRVAYSEHTVDATTIQMTIPIGWSVGDCLIAYISKDDDWLVDDLVGWTTLVSETAGTGNALYIAYRIAESGDTDWTWGSTGDTGEDWLGEIICYTGNDTSNPIHASGFTVQAGTDNTPIAPSVSFGDPTPLAAGSMVFQCFGEDTNDSPYTIPAQLTEIFSTGFEDTGGAGGDKADLWESPTSFNETGWTNEYRAYDKNTSSFAYITVYPTAWSPYLELNISAISCSKVRFQALSIAEEIDRIILEVYYSDGWHEIYDGAYADDEWVEKAIGSTQTVTAMKAKFYNLDSGNHTAYFYEASFFQVDISGSGNTGTAVFGMDGTDTWVAATVIIEAEEEEPPPPSEANVMFMFSMF